MGISDGLEGSDDHDSGHSNRPDSQGLTVARAAFIDTLTGKIRGGNEEFTIFQYENGGDVFNLAFDHRDSHRMIIETLTAMGSTGCKWSIAMLGFAQYLAEARREVNPAECDPPESTESPDSPETEPE